jgi:hypothetical protein
MGYNHAEQFALYSQADAKAKVFTRGCHMKNNPVAYLIYRVERWSRGAPLNIDMRGLNGIVILILVVWCYVMLALWAVEKMSGLPVAGAADVFPYEMHYSVRTAIGLPFVFGLWWIVFKVVDFDALMADYEKESEEEHKRRTLPLWVFSLGPYLMLIAIAIWD